MVDYIFLINLMWLPDFFKVISKLLNETVKQFKNLLEMNQISISHEPFT